MTLTFFGYLPPARFDLIPWVSARLEQSADVDGSYAAVDTFTLTPVDVDPKSPQNRSFTTEAATDGDWFRFVFIGSDGSESEPTLPVQFLDVSAALVTRAELAALLKVDATTYATALDRVLLCATCEIYSEVGESAATANALQRALAEEVCLERAAEHWAQKNAPFGFVQHAGEGLGMPAIAARDSWDRHALKLAPLKSRWGFA